MNKLILMITLALSSVTVVANPGNTVPSAETMLLEANFANIKKIYTEDKDKSRKIVGGLMAFQGSCLLEWSKLGQLTIDMIINNDGMDNIFVSEGFTNASKKIEKFGCNMAKSVVKKDATGVQFFNF